MDSSTQVLGKRRRTPTKISASGKRAKGRHKPKRPSSQPCNGGKSRKKRPCRFDSSLSLLTKKFVELINQQKDKLLDLNEAADKLQVQKRRIYDITNVLEGIGLIEKKSKNRIHWKAEGICQYDQHGRQLIKLQEELAEAKQQEEEIDRRRTEIKDCLDHLGTEENQKLAFVTHEDIKNLDAFQGSTLITIKAPSGTTLEVSEKNEDENAPNQYSISLESTKGPISVYPVVEPVNGVEYIGEVALPHVKSKDMDLPSAEGFRISY